MIRDLNHLISRNDFPMHILELDLFPFESIISPNEAEKDASFFIMKDNYIALNSTLILEIFTSTLKKYKLYRLDQELSEATDISQSTMILLLIQPELYSCWNTRMQLVEKHFSTIEYELRFTALLLSKYPKRPFIWSFRFWLIKKQFLSEFHFSYYAIESQIIIKAAEKYPSNYHAWSYRRCLFMLVYPDCSQSELQTEQEIVWTFLKRHPSDFSAWTYFSNLVNANQESNSLSNLIILTKDEFYKELINLQFVYGSHPILSSWIENVATICSMTG